MESIDTMDLSGNDDGSTPLESVIAPKIQEEKNVNKIVKMDSTPLNDVMSGPADWETTSQIGSMPPQMPAAQPQFMMSQAPQPQAPPPKQNPMNLTDEQMMALLVGAVAAVASSKPVQEKLASMIPQLAADPQGMTSLLVTGLVAAVLFYFGKRFVM
jgi:hypothetical protein